VQARNLLAAVFDVSSHWLNPSFMADDCEGERGRAKLRNRLMFDEHLLRDIGFREEVSRFHRSRFPGF
jgi:hypothetical protein